MNEIKFRRRLQLKAPKWSTNSDCIIKWTHVIILLLLFSYIDIHKYRFFFFNPGKSTLKGESKLKQALNIKGENKFRTSPVIWHEPEAEWEALLMLTYKTLQNWLSREIAQIAKRGQNTKERESREYTIKKNPKISKS